jgi:hypothetical protein
LKDGERGRESVAAKEKAYVSYIKSREREYLRQTSLEISTSAKEYRREKSVAQGEERSAGREYRIQVSRFQQRRKRVSQTDQKTEISTLGTGYRR